MSDVTKCAHCASDNVMHMEWTEKAAVYECLDCDRYFSVFDRAAPRGDGPPPRPCPDCCEGATYLGSLGGYHCWACGSWHAVHEGVVERDQYPTKAKHWHPQRPPRHPPADLRVDARWDGG